MEYQAIVMAAGRGSRMTDLVHTKPKCLLPVGNKPMIWYSLKLLEDTGFEEAIVIVHDNYKAEVAAIPSKYGLNIKLDVCCVSKSDDSGTVDSLRHVKEKIKTDVLILSSDLVTDVKLQNVFDMHRTHGASFTTVFNPVSPDVIAAPVPGPKSKPKQECDLVGLDIQTSRLVFFGSEADFVSENEDDDQELSIRKSIMKYFPQISMHSDLFDAHIYVMKKWVVDYITDTRSMIMLKGDVLPQLVEMQFKKLPKRNHESELPNPDASVASFNAETRDIFSYLSNTEEEEKIRSYSVWNDHVGDLRGPYQDQNIRCFAFIPKDCFCMRANTLSSYCELNRQIIKRWSTMFPSLEVTPPVTKAQIGADCLIGDSILSDKCSIKHSVIGQSCTIGEKVRIANCILMDNVTVREGTSLQGSVLMDNVIVEARCDIKDCLIGQTIHASSKSSNEILVDADTRFEI